jgi:hypothetical protein
MKQLNQKDWVSSEEAAAILRRRSGRKIADSYVRQLAIEKRIRRVQIDRRTYRYSRVDTEAYPVRPVAGYVDPDNSEDDKPRDEQFEMAV